jgi:membrane protein YqaA with SNARE-associated domain
VHGRVHRSRVVVRIGTPAGDIGAARRAVTELAGCGGDRAPDDAARPDSAVRRRVARLAAGRTGGWVVFFWGFAEALSWPVLPEFALGVAVVAAPRQAPRLAGLAAAGSLTGGAAMYLLAAHGWAPPGPLTTPRMHATAAAQVATEGARAITRQPLSGIPYKVYGAAAGHAHAGLAAFLGWSVPARALRILAAGLLAGAVGGLARRLRRWYPLYLCCFTVLSAAALTGVVTSWS